MPKAHDHDWSFFHWAGVGFLIVFGVLAILSIGAPFFLLGLVLLGVLLGRGPRWPASLGFFAGAGLVCMVIAIISSVPNPAGWAAAGIALLGFSAGAFWWLSCRTPISR